MPEAVLSAKNPDYDSIRPDGEEDASVSFLLSSRFFVIYQWEWSTYVALLHRTLFMDTKAPFVLCQIPKGCPLS